MLYVLAELASGRLYAGQLLNALQHTTFNTPLGAVGFDRGELRGAMTCVWTPVPTGLTPVTR